MKRLYLRIYFTFILILILFGVLASATWYLLPEDKGHKPFFDGFGTVLKQIIPKHGSSKEDLQQALEQLSMAFPGQLSLRSDNGELLAVVGRPLRPPHPKRKHSGWLRSKGRGPAWAINLSDGRWLMVKPEHNSSRHLGFLATIALLAGLLAIGVYPLAKSLTGRIERLKSQVNKLGAGELSTRVLIEGKDEVAALASSFNRAAQKIEKLVASHKSLLASVSHELRTPLTRIRMGIELLDNDERRDLCNRMSKDVLELDDLIGELLLASRLDTLDRLENSEEVDLLALLAEEAVVVGAEVEGESVLVWGDKRLLRRLIRNLMENARRYGGNSGIESSVNHVDNFARLRVSDHGEGIPQEEVEHIFKPYYKPIAAKDSNFGGVGLGLSLVKQIANHHGGDATYFKRENGGSTFEVTLALNVNRA
ncbi:MAG: HAMP domain-containing histidine kinase [Magnetococcales bacterium]|nr:HAMP domain-containing histidine kinase [Magnetococcales bacterium]